MKRIFLGLAVACMSVIALVASSAQGASGKKAYAQCTWTAQVNTLAPIQVTGIGSVICIGDNLPVYFSGTICLQRRASIVENFTGCASYTKYIANFTSRSIYPNITHSCVNSPFARYQWRTHLSVTVDFTSGDTLARSVVSGGSPWIHCA